MSGLNPFELPLGGTALIEASAGTGKTYALTTLYLRLLVERDLLPSQILVVTYTQAATAELRERVRERIRKAITAGAASESELSAIPELDAQDLELGRRARAMREDSGRPDPLRRALQEFDEAAIFTIHGFCQRTLEQNAFESGVAFDAELIEAADVMEQTLARDLWAREIATHSPAFVEWLLQGKGKRWQFEPDALKRELLGLMGADEEMPVLPKAAMLTPDPGDLAAMQSELHDAWRDWALEWPAGRVRVEQWFLEASDLNRTGYKAATIEGVWLPHLASLCEGVTKRLEGGEQAGFDLPAWWSKWTREGLAAGVKKSGTPIDDTIFDAFAKILELTDRIEASYSDCALAARQRFVRGAREESRRRRDERHQLVFDDLLSELRSALRPPDGHRLIEQLRKQYHFALIDEFQDTDPVQYEIFRSVWHVEADVSDRDGSRGLILIGDPKQAIYSFRGADLYTYLAAKEDAGDAVHGLGVNWRSTPGLIHTVNELFGRPADPFGIEEVEFDRVSPRPDAPAALDTQERSPAGLRVLLAEYARVVTAVEAPSESAEKKASAKKKKKPQELPLRFGRTELMHAFARDVADLLDSGARIGERAVQPSDIAVLCRRKSELERARRALEALGIPCVDRGDADVFETREGWELLCVLRAMLHPGDPASLRAGLATGAMGWNASALSVLADDSAELGEASERFAEYARLWRQSGFMHAFEFWRRREGVTPRLLAYVDGERRLTNWLHLAELLQKMASERSPSQSGLANWLERAIADPDLRTSFGSDASLLRLESDLEAVSLSTLHRSKGLEYEIVYLPCLWEDATPRGPAEDVRELGTKKMPPVRCYDPGAGKRILDLGSTEYGEHLRLQKEEALSESLRLLYVGLTRAKRQCVVMWGAIGNGAYASTPLAWLLVAPAWQPAGQARSTSIDEIRGWTDEQWRAAWSALGEAAGEGAVSIESANWDARDRWNAPTEDLAALAFDRRTRPLPTARVTTSFSGLTRGAYRSVESSIGPEAIGRDLDAQVHRIGDSGNVEASDLDTDLDAEMGTFPRGADAGTLLHEVLEQVRFWNWEEDDVRKIASQALLDHGFDSAAAHQRYPDQIVHVVRSVAEVPLYTDPTPFRLADVRPGQLRPEMEFTISTSGSPDADGFTPEALSALLREAPIGSPLQRYAGRVTRLSWRRLRGYLRGFIDAVFFDGERFFLVDYKSNHLGTRQADYARESLVASMIEHDYVLQYLIYSIALDRYLSQSLEGYSYEANFGGAYYLYLRGISEGHATGSGIFYDRPSDELVRSVSGLLGSGFQEGAPQ